MLIFRRFIRVACICSLGFAGFFRYDELSNIAPANFFPDHLRVFVPRAKNDIYRVGNYVYIKRLTSVYCPVALLERYISMGNIELSSSVALFRPVRFFKFTNSYKLYGVKLSYTRCREIFKDCLKEIGVDHKLYCLHSLRSGGATLQLVIILIFQKEYSSFTVGGSPILQRICIFSKMFLGVYK